MKRETRTSEISGIYYAEQFGTPGQYGMTCSTITHPLYLPVTFTKREHEMMFDAMYEDRAARRRMCRRLTGYLSSFIWQQYIRLEGELIQERSGKELS